MPCSGRFASVDDYNNLLCAAVDPNDPIAIADIERALDLAASDVHMALAAVGACDCTLASYALSYLKKLNVIDAAVIQNCPCGNSFTPELRQSWLEWLENQYALIREGKITLCEGETGANFPAFARAEHSWTEANAARIIENELARMP